MAPGDDSGNAQTVPRDRIEQERREPVAAAYGFARARASIPELPASPAALAALFAAPLSSSGAVIDFADEAALRADAHCGTTWAPVGQPPVVADSGDRFGLRWISAVSPRGDWKFATVDGRRTSQRLVALLKQLRADTGQPIRVIADNATAPKDGSAKRYRQATTEGIRVELRPTYSPELNPDAQVWKHLKARLGKLVIESKEQRQRVARATWLSIQRNLKRVLSFFELKDTQYAANAV